jgi:virginiamycin B lyase
VTYDAYDASNNTIPGGAATLSAAQKVPFGIEAGRANAIAVTLEGVPSTVALVPDAGSALTGNQSSGLVFPKCNGNTQAVHVYGVDADGNFILGKGAPDVSLTSGDVAQLTVAQPPPLDPNTFVLTPPSPPGYPHGNHTTVLTATVTPGSASGASAATVHVNVKYTGDICGIYDVFEVPTANAQVRGITAGPDGALWFTEFTGNKIGRIPTNVGASTDIREFSIPTANSGAIAIVAGSDGNLWFVEPGGPKVARISPGATSGSQIVEFSVPSGGEPVGIAAGSDGDLWFTECVGDRIGRIAPSATSGSDIREYSTPSAHSFPLGIVSRPSSLIFGNMWFTEAGTGSIASISTRAFPPPVITEFSEGMKFPAGIAVGPDGDLWVADEVGNAVHRITLGSADSPFGLPTAMSNPSSIIRGPDNALWFTESGAAKIGRITTGGTLMEYTIAPSSNPDTIATGSDGALWFTESGANVIGRLR